MSNNQPKVSVIIPVYNVEQYLRKCLDSVINQTYKNLEIICINDGSLDNCGAILDEYVQKDSRIIVIHQKNAGVSDARNKGLRNAQGEYILFVDPDDWCETDLIETAIEGFKDDEIDLVYWGSNIIVEREISDEEFYIHQRANSCYRNGKYPTTGQLVETLTGRVSNKLFKAEILKNYNIKFPSCKCFEDLFFNLSYYKHTRYIYFIRKNLDNYLLRKNSAVATMASYNNSNSAIENLFNVFKNIYLEYKENNELELFNTLVFSSLFQRFMFNVSFLNKEQQDYYLNELRVFFTNLDKSYDWSRNEDIQNILNGEFYKYYHLQIPYYSIGNKLAGVFLYKNERSRLVIYLLGIKLSLRLKFLDWRKER